MVRLGNHPEVSLCTRCARWVYRQAREIEDWFQTGPAVRGRNSLRSARRKVVRRGWHRLPVLGGILRWLGKHLP